MHQISQNITWYRRHKRYSQQELADVLDTTLGRVKTYEGGKATPPIEMLLKLSDLMDLSIDAIVKVKLDASIYPALKKEKIKEQKNIDSFSKINERLTSVELQLKKSLKQKVKQKQ